MLEADDDRLAARVAQLTHTHDHLVVVAASEALPATLVELFEFGPADGDEDDEDDEDDETTWRGQVHGVMHLRYAPKTRVPLP
eukprot:5455307-Pyramimonas_sp.AAC.2